MKMDTVKPRGQKMNEEIKNNSGKSEKKFWNYKRGFLSGLAGITSAYFLFMHPYTREYTLPQKYPIIDTGGGSEHQKQDYLELKFRKNGTHYILEEKDIRQLHGYYGEDPFFMQEENLGGAPYSYLKVYTLDGKVLYKQPFPTHYTHGISFKEQFSSNKRPVGKMVPNIGKKKEVYTVYILKDSRMSNKIKVTKHGIF